jgi:hypothetical protein
MTTSTHQPRAPDEVEREFVDHLRVAAYIFQTKKNGRFEGAIRACAAVVRFIKRRGGPAEYAAPFMHIAEAFKELERGGRPRLFSKKTIPAKERERSPERKHMQMLAAAMLEALMKLGDERNVAAEQIARYVNKWPGMAVQTVTGKTVIGWREQQHRLDGEPRKRFDKVVDATLAEPQPRSTIEGLLRNGPPGSWNS